MLHYTDVLESIIRQIPRGQGVCPECGMVFQGCAHPDMLNVWRADKATLRHGGKLIAGAYTRYELVRDDGDMYVGLGSSYSYLEWRDDGMHRMSPDFAKDHGLLDLSNRWEKRQLDAIEGRENKDNRELVFVRIIKSGEKGTVR